MTSATVYSDNPADSASDTLSSRESGQTSSARTKGASSSHKKILSPWRLVLNVKPLLHILSAGWVLAVLTYVLTVSQSQDELPISFFAIAGLIAAVPAASFSICALLISQIDKVSRTNREVLYSLRQMGNPVTMACEDVKTVSSTVSGELTNLRTALREIEDGLGSVQGTFEERILQLRETSQAVQETISGVSGHLGNERQALLELIQVINQEVSELSRQTSYMFDNIKTHRTGLSLASEILLPSDDTNEDRIQPAPWVNDKRAQAVTNAFHEEVPNTPPVDFLSEEQSHASGTDIEMPSFLYSGANPEETEGVAIKQSQEEIISGEETVSQEEVRFTDSAVIRKERHLYDGLHALSIDFNRILETNPPSDLWRQYMRGERDVFTAYLSDWLEGKSQKIRLEYDNNEEFRRLTARYISQYEALRERLSQYDNASALRDEITHSVAGKLYVTLMAVNVQYA